MGESVTARRQLRKWQKELIIQSVCEEANIFNEIEVVEILFYSLNDEQVTGAPDWESAVRLALEARTKFPMPHFDAILSMHPREVALGNASKVLRCYGFEVDIEDGPRLSPISIARFNDEIESLCKELGGKQIIDHLLKSIDQCWDPILKRYHLSRIVSSGANQPIPQIPWGYLLQLGIKFAASETKDSLDNQRRWTHLIELLVAGIALEDVQPYTSLEPFVQGPDSILEFLQRSVLYDAMFTITQIRADHAQMICDGLLHYDQFNDLKHDGIALRTAVEAGIRAIDRAAEKRISRVSLTDLESNTATRDEITRICESVFTQSAGLNQQLSYPPRSTSIDSLFYPLIDAPGYCALPKSICAPQVIESLLTFIRNAWNQQTGINETLGKWTEHFLLERLAAHGVSARSGTYQARIGNSKQKELQCDCVIETAETIFFIELKNKPLTRKARSGTDIDLVVDLCQSVLGTQVQALRHEVALKTNRQIRWTWSSDDQDKLEWNDRRIDRMSVSLFDFASLQDKASLIAFLNTCCRVEIGTYSVDSQIQKKFVELNESLHELRFLLEELVKLGSVKRNLFIDSWFVSVPQLLQILDSVNSNEDFERELLRVKHVTTGYRDFYREYGDAIRR
ncbi:MAG: hypothetical protein AB7W16_01845 [Candidatus Obscuribacterales bacterium]